MAPRWRAAWALVMVGIATLACAAVGEPAPPRDEAPEPRQQPEPPGPSAGSARGPVAPLGPEHEARIDAVVEAAIREGQAPGAVVAVVRPEGIAFLRAYGARQVVPARQAMHDDAIFDLASLTKPITALAVMRLVEAGELALDDPVMKHRPSFGAAGKSRVTIAELMDHSSGLVAANALADYRDDPFAAIDALPIVGRGVRRYSDVGYIVLGDVLARRGGASLSAVIAREVLAPLGMTETTFGTASPRAVPTTERDGRMLRGEVHDPRAAALGGVAGHAGLFSTARDLARLARMLLGEGMIDGVRFLAPETVRMLHAPRGGGDGLAFSRMLGGWGHLGFTGTMLWIAPKRNLAAILLTSRLHPDGRGDVARLRQAIGAIVADAEGTVLTGADVVARDRGPLVGRRVGLVSNHTAVTRDGRRTADVLQAAPDVDLVALFAPEHGLSGKLEGAVDDARDAPTGLVVHSLYGSHRRPTPAQLVGIDTLVFDIQDVGARFYTYITTLGYLLEVAEREKLRVVVLDRPNPLGGTVVEGPVLDDDLRSFVGYHPLPIRHGLTVGELARLFVADRRMDVDLHVVAMQGWRRDMLHPRTGLAWRPPSPNLPSARAALLYPGVALLEGTNVSVGRGTDRPFELVGAPWLDAAAVLAAMEPVAGVALEATIFTPNASKHAGHACRGLAIRVTDPATFRPVDFGVALALAFRKVHPRRWQAQGMLPLLGDRRTFDAVLAARPLEVVRRGFEPERARFEEARAKVLLYL